MRPPAIREVEPGLLEIREGGGCVSLLGVPFLLAGVFLALVAVGAVPVQNADEVPSWVGALLGFMGLAFTAVGGRLVLGRTWTRLDVNRGRVARRWGLLVPMTSEESRLDDYDAVTLSLAREGSDVPDQYPVALRGRGKRADLMLAGGSDFGVAREQAGVVAQALGLPLVDATAGLPSVIDATLARATFQERVRSGRESLEDHPRPPKPRSVVRQVQGGTEIVIPAAPFRRIRLLGVAVPAGVLAWVGPGVLNFFRQTGTPEAVQIAAAAFAALFFVGIPLLGTLDALLLSARGRTTVQVDGDGIRMEKRGAWTTKHTRIVAADILGLGCGATDTAVASSRGEARRRMERVGRRLPPTRPGGREPGWVRRMRRLVPSDGVIVKTRNGLVPVGAGLPDDEVRYLHAVIAEALGR